LNLDTNRPNIPFLCRHVEKKKHLVVVAMQKKAASALYAKDKKLKRVAEAAPSKDDETCSGLFFKRKRKVDVAIPVPSDSDGRAPSYRECPPNASSPRDIVVQKGRGESASEGASGILLFILLPANNVAICQS